MVITDQPLNLFHFLEIRHYTVSNGIAEMETIWIHSIPHHFRLVSCCPLLPANRSWKNRSRITATPVTPSRLQIQRAWENKEKHHKPWCMQFHCRELKAGCLRPYRERSMCTKFFRLTTEVKRFGQKFSTSFAFLFFFRGGASHFWRECGRSGSQYLTVETCASGNGLRIEFKNLGSTSTATSITILEGTSWSKEKNEIRKVQRIPYLFFVAFEEIE